MELENIRKEIDSIDNQILQLVTKRFELAKEIALIKKQSKLPLEDKEREAQLIEARIKKMKELGVDDRKLVEELFTLVMKKSKQIQKEEMQ